MAIEFLEWLAATPLSSGLRRSALVYMAVNGAHILSIGLLIGAILPLDLRLMGLFGSVPLAVIRPVLVEGGGHWTCGSGDHRPRPFQREAGRICVQHCLSLEAWTDLIRVL